MRKLLLSVALGAMVTASPLAAHDTTTGYATRGECEATSTQTSNAEMERVLAANPHLFSSVGEVRSFLTRAWQCEISADGQWYISDHRRDTLNSDWFQRRM